MAVAWAIRYDAFLAPLFWGMAAVAAVSGQPETAARLIGAAEALDARTGRAMWPNDRALADRCLARLEQVLEPAAFAALRGAGAALPEEQALAMARLVAASVLGEGRAAAIWGAVGAPEPLAVGDALMASVERQPDDRAPATGIGDLTRREREILGLLCARLTDREIAARLFLSHRTVETHVRHILAKLGAANRRDAAAIAARHLLV
jgi:DNA-binding CsgD family transcriptional regulator